MEIFSVVEAPRLHLLECEGDVAIKGWEEASWLEERTQAFPPSPGQSESEELIVVEEDDTVFSQGEVLGK